MSRGRPWCFAALCGIAALGWAGAASAAGAPAGTAIQNSASVSADLGGVAVNAVSNAVTTVVLELLDVDVTLQSATNVLVRPGETERVLVFQVTNVGNGIERFSLGVVSTGLGGDFDPQFNRIALDDGDGVYEPGVDPDYLPGTNDPILDGNDPAADFAVVFVLNDIPAGVVDGNLGLSELRATSTTGTGAAGTLLAGTGDGGVDAVIGAAGGSDPALGAYEVSTLVVSIAKTSTVADPFGGSLSIPGAAITYRLVVSVVGVDTAQAVVVRDAIPANTTYTPGTLTRDGLAQTDADDAPTDASFFDSANNRVVFGLGDLPGGTPDQTLTFQVTID